MVVAVTQGSQTLTVQFADDEWYIVQWMMKMYGANVFDSHLKDLLKGRTAQMEATEKEIIYSAIKKLDKSSKDDILKNLKVEL